MKIVILGFKRSGKDTVCEMACDRYGLEFASTSAYVADKIMLPAFAQTGKIYGTWSECFQDRVNHRKFWYDTITAYNTPDKARLAREILDKYDVYCGIRNKEEFYAAKEAKLFDVAIWVDASQRVGEIESSESCTVSPEDADYIIDNNGSLENLEARVKFLFGQLLRSDQ